jgi:hypothetical protein
MPVNRGADKMLGGGGYEPKDIEGRGEGERERRMREEDFITIYIILTMIT